MTPWEGYQAGQVARFGWDPRTEPSGFEALRDARVEWADSRADFPRDFNSGHALRQKFAAGWHAMAWHLAAESVVAA